MEQMQRFLSPSLFRMLGATGDTWNLPNYDGALYTASDTETALLRIIGGLNGGLQTNNFEFPTASLYVLPNPSQPEISETDSETAPAASHVARTQEKNVTQIFQEAINVTYAKLSNAGRLSGINTAGSSNNVASETNFQIARKLDKVAKDVNWTFHNGTYQISTAANVANKTRGMFELISTLTQVDAQGAELSKPLMDSLLLAMYDAGAIFSNVIIFTNGYQKQKISSLYTVLPQSRNVGGQNIQQIITDFGNLGIQLDRDVPSNKLGFYEVSQIAPVFQPVPEKGNLFFEPLAKTGAAEKSQLFGQIGLDHGPAFMHGALVNLSTGA